jgi:hypothetical protein
VRQGTAAVQEGRQADIPGPDVRAVLAFVVVTIPEDGASRDPAVPSGGSGLPRPRDVAEPG